MAALEDTRARRSARIAVTVFNRPRREGGSISLVSEGIVDLENMRVMLAERLGTKPAGFLAELTTPVRSLGLGGAVTPSDGSHMRLFEGNTVYEQAGPRWVKDESEWWERPLWALRVLSAVDRDVSVVGRGSVGDVETNTYGCMLNPDGARQLGNDAPDRRLLGKNARRPLALTVEVDDGGLIRRISSELTLSRRDPPDYRETDLWDHGLTVSITMPSDDDTVVPASARGMLHDFYRMMRGRQ